jgi:hypothetical protein
VAAPAASEAVPAGSATPPPTPAPAPTAPTPPAPSAAPPPPEAKPSAAPAPSAAAAPAPTVIAKSPAPAPAPTVVVREATPTPKNDVGLRWRLEIVGGARSPTGAPSWAEPQTGIGVSAWPSAVGGHFGVGAVVQFGLGTSLNDESTFSAQFTQGSLTLTARGRTTLGPLGFEVQAGPSLRVTSLSVTLDNSNDTTQKPRADFALDAAAVVDVALGSHLSLGVLGDVSALLSWHDYELSPGSGLFFYQPPVDLFCGARLSLEVD